MKWISILAAGMLSLSSLFVSVSAYSEEAPNNIKGVITINTHQAKKLHELGALFIDVRPYKQWGFGRVEGAQNLDLRIGFRQLFMPGTLDKETPIVVYGNSNYHMRGAIASYLAALWGYKKVFFFRDGYYSWLALDYPVTLKSDTTQFNELLGQTP